MIRSAVDAISGHLVVLWVDFPFGEVIVLNGVVDLQYCVAQKAFHAMINLFRLLE